MTEQVRPNEVTPKRPRKPSSEWKKTPRLKAIKEKSPDFIAKAEMAHHLQCHVSTIDEWIADGTIPPPHSRPGTKHPVWLRKHYEHYRDTGKWPNAARHHKESV